MGRKGRGRRAAESPSSGSDGAGQPPAGGAAASRAFEPPARGGTAPKAGGRRRRGLGAAAPADPPSPSNAARAAPDVRSMTSIALRSHHGRHVTVDATGDVKASSSVIRDAEKLDLVNNDDGTVSLRSWQGKYVGVEKSGDLRATRDSIGESEKFQLLCHSDGTVSLQGQRGFLSAEAKAGLKANRALVGAWEKFQPKDRSRTSKPAVGADAEGGAGAQVGEAAGNAEEPQPLFDACCQLQAVLAAEEQYASEHNDRAAVAFGKRARERRLQGLTFSFQHFRREHGYTAAFVGCVSWWDATAVSLPGEGFGETAGASEGAAGGDEQASRARSCSGGQGSDGGAAADRHAWASMLEEDAGAETALAVRAAFGIPAASAAEADDAAFARLRRLCRSPHCVAVGPVGLSFPPAPELSAAVKDRHRGLSAAAIADEFGAPPTAAYRAPRDPACTAWLAAGGTKAEDWMVRHGDRRLAEFNAARADYEQRRVAAQVAVAERQALLAKELGLPLIVQLPAQDEAERRMAELLVSALGGPGCLHPVLLSAFQGRPKCAAALLQHFPGLVVGFSGLLTHAKLQDSLGEVAFDTPLHRLVLESLGPRYPPAGVGGGRGAFSHPAHIAAVAAELARVKRVAPAEVCQAATENARRLFRLGAGGTADAKGAALAATPSTTDALAAGVPEVGAPESNALDGVAAPAAKAPPPVRRPTRERLKGRSPFLRPKDLQALFKDMDGDGDGALGMDDLRGFLCDYLGYGLAEAVAFHTKYAALGSGVSFEAFKRGLPELSAYLVRERSACTVVRQPGAFGGLEGVDFHVEDCVGCRVLVCDRAAEFFADGLRDCQVLVGPCSSSTFIRNCSGCTFWLATRQFRTRDCEDCAIYLHCHTEPIIESSGRLSFAPFAAEYPGLAEHFRAAGFDPERNLWSAVYDFSGRQGHCNWRIQPLDECDVLAVSFDGRPDLEADAAAPALTQALLVAPPVKRDSEDGPTHSLPIPQTRPPPPPTPTGNGPRRLLVTDADEPSLAGRFPPAAAAAGAGESSSGGDEVSVADSGDSGE